MRQFQSLKAFKRVKSEPGRRFSGSAFTLAELLAVLLVIGLLYAGVALALSAPFFDHSSPAAQRREAIKAASWIRRVFHKALLSGRGFRVRIFSWHSQSRIVIQWDSPFGNEIYDTRGKTFFVNNSIYGDLFSVYSGKWNTLTPALTIRVVPTEISPRAFKTPLYIVISPYGRISLRDSPP